MPDLSASSDKPDDADRAAVSAYPAAAAAGPAIAVQPAWLTADAAQPIMCWRPSRTDIAAAASSPVLLAAHPGLPYQTVHNSDPRNLPINDGT